MDKKRYRADLPDTDALFSLGELAQRYVSEINRSPFDWGQASPFEASQSLAALYPFHSFGPRWVPSELLSADDPARIEEPPVSMPQPAGLLGALNLLPGSKGVAYSTGYNKDEYSRATRQAELRESSRRQKLEARHRSALGKQFFRALSTNPAYQELKPKQEFLQLWDAFISARDESKPGSRLREPAAQAKFISLVALSLSRFQSGASRRVPTQVDRKKAAVLIDKLLALSTTGVSPPFHFGRSGIVSVADELQRWHDQLLAKIPEGRQRTARNDDYLPHRDAVALFANEIHRAFETRLDSVVERFMALIGYRNPAAQSSR